MDTCFEHLMKRISPTLKRITYKLNGHYSFFNDEDLFQEAMIHLWNAYKQGKLNDKTDSYILQGCYFHIKNYIRKIKDKPLVISFNALIGDNEVDLDEALCLKDAGVGIADLENKSLVEQIRDNGLSEREKKVFCLCLQGLTVREVGKRLGISHVWVVKLMGRIKEKCNKYKEF
jgi:RNA polymerase sigma factor (sigma-70 family)